MRIVVDGMNVIGTRPDGWWRDRPGARKALVERLARLVASGDSVTVVFDGRPIPGEAKRAADLGVTAVFAPGGPNAADDAVVELVPAMLGEDDLVVVTSDRALSRRVQGLGARVEGSKALLTRLDKWGVD